MVFPEEALLKAVIAEPEDDAPRLIYADWLEENGQEARAEFIRVQVALTRLKEGEREYRALRDRSLRLLWAHGLVWAGPFRDAKASWMFTRGFISDATCDLQAFLDHAVWLFAHAPLQRITINRIRGGLAHFLALPQLLRIQALGLSLERLDDDDASALARCSYLKCLNHLVLFGNQIGDSGARALASSPYLDSLDYLELSNNPTLTSAGHAVLRRRFGERVHF